MRRYEKGAALSNGVWGVCGMVPRQTSFQRRLEQLLERRHAEPRVGRDPAHGMGVYRIVARDGKKPVAVGHHNMLAPLFCQRIAV